MEVSEPGRSKRPGGSAGPASAAAAVRLRADRLARRGRRSGAGGLRARGRAASAVEPGTRFHSWVFKIAHSIWTGRRHAAVRGGHGEPVDPDTLRAATASGSGGEACLADVRRLVAELPADQRAALMLVAVDGLVLRGDAVRMCWAFRLGPWRAGWRAPVWYWRWPWKAWRSWSPGARAGVGEEWVMTRKVDPATPWPIWTASLAIKRGRCRRASGRSRAVAQLTSLERVDTTLAAAFDPGSWRHPCRPWRSPSGHRFVASAHVRRSAANRLAWAAGVGGLIVGFAAGQFGPLLLPQTEPAVAATNRNCRRSWRASPRHNRRVQRPNAGRLGHGPADSVFVNADGRYCRAYEARAGDEQGQRLAVASPVATRMAIG